MKLFLFSIAITSLLVSGCSNSLLFSPALNAPRTPLAKEQTQLFGGGTMLVETRRSNTTENALTRIGADGGVRYAFTNVVTGQVRGWFGDSQRWGLSFSAWVALSSPSASHKICIVPAFGTAMIENRIEGNGIGASALYMYTKHELVTPYLALTPMYGWNSNDFLNGTKYGYGASLTMGGTFNVTTWLSCNAEFNALTFYDRNSRSTEYVVSPSLMLQCTL
ncbi:MAG: hypothetical protein JNL32_06885 [Candidatus Kapabacteria bacterium]|nr:hypothetical protein [Candidatus Kapabacteria bacterium]